MQNDLRANQFNKLCGNLKRITLKDGGFNFLPVDDLGKISLGSASKWITKDEFASLVINRVWGVISERADEGFSDAGSGNLQEILGESVIHNIANGVIDEINKFPLKFDATISLPNVKVPGRSAVAFPGIKILSLESHSKNLLQMHGDSNFDIRLSVGVEGYANWMLDSSAAVGAIEKIKVLLHWWLAKRVIYIDRIRSTYGSLFFNGGPNHVFDKQYLAIQRHDNGGITNPQLPLDLTLTLLSMQLSDDLKKSSADAVTNALLGASVEALNLLAMESREAKAICAAAEWSFNSNVGENETMAFLQVCFGFEALFGDGDPKSVTKNLASRCAFAVAPRVSQRADIMNQFEKFYQARSKIVHGQVARLNGNDRALLSWARGLLQLAIQSEAARI